MHLMKHSRKVWLHVFQVFNEKQHTAKPDTAKHLYIFILNKHTFTPCRKIR